MLENMSVRGSDIISLSSYKILGCMSSGPQDLLTLRCFNFFCTSSNLMLIFSSAASYALSAK